MKKIAIIGANEFQKKLVLKAKEMGIETHVFAWEEGAVAKEVSDYFYPISITDKDSIIDILKDIRLNGICSIASDLAMPTVNYIAEQLNLVGNSQECTILTTNKYEMRKKLEEKCMPIPSYQLIKNIEDVDYSNIGYPVIVKPIDRSGSRGIYKATNKQQLSEAIIFAKSVSFTDEILVEEYVDGKEYSVEAISQNGKHKILQVTEKFTTGSPNFIEKAHLSPARVSYEIKNEVFKVIEKALEVLMVENGASHSEIKISEKGDIKIIEIAARMGGDFIGSDMVEISTGFDFVKNVIKIAIGEEIDFNYNERERYALVKFILDRNDIYNFENIKTKLPYVVREINIDSEMKNVTDSSTRNGYCILETDEYDELATIFNMFDMD